jgi:altronate dehydratase
VKTVFVIESGDNVGTAVLEDSIKKGDWVSAAGGVTGIAVIARADIPYGHKIALRFIKKGEPVIKYGLIISTACADIHPGDHVHLHNTTINRRRGSQTAAKV